MPRYRDREGNNFQNLLNMSTEFLGTLWNSGKEIFINLWDSGENGLHSLPRDGWLGAVRTGGLWVMNIAERGVELAQSAIGYTANAQANRGDTDQERNASRNVSYTKMLAPETEYMHVEKPTVPDTRDPESRSIGT